VGRTRAWGVFGFSVLGALASQAHASAWRAPEESLTVFSSISGEREDGSFSEMNFYWEDRLTARFDGVLNVHVQLDEKFEPAPGPGVQAAYVEPSGEVFVGGKMTLRDRPDTVVSAQVGLLGVGGLKDDCGDAGAEARLLAGAARGDFFVDAQGAYRVRAGGCPTSKLDITVGWEPDERWMGLAQTFVDVDPRYDPVVKLQLSLVRFSKKGKGVQVGVRVRADEAGKDERALVVSWWRAPHKSVSP
jgi:hypothetical protein